MYNYSGGFLFLVSTSQNLNNLSRKRSLEFICSDTLLNTGPTCEFVCKVKACCILSVFRDRTSIPSVSKLLVFDHPSLENIIPIPNRCSPCSFCSCISYYSALLRYLIRIRRDVFCKSTRLSFHSHVIWHVWTSLETFSYAVWEKRDKEGFWCWHFKALVLIHIWPCKSGVS